MSVRPNDYVRYYLVFSPTELALPAEAFYALLEDRLFRAACSIIVQRAEPVTAA